MIITIDGPASSGKSTVASLLAKKLNFIHLNSGSIFRAVTAFLVKQNFNIENISSISPIPQLAVEIKFINKTQQMFVNDENFTPFLRDNQISQLVPKVALNINVRNLVDDCQKEFAKTNNIVIEGRDTGSHVFPNADVKFYLECSIKERALRRFKEEKSKNNNISLEEIEKQIEERDNLDKTREIAPLIIPKNAIIIDTTTLTIDEVVEKLCERININN